MSRSARQLPPIAHPASNPTRTAKGRISMPELDGRLGGQLRFASAPTTKTTVSPADAGPTSELEVPGRRVQLLRTRESRSSRPQQLARRFSCGPSSCSSRVLLGLASGVCRPRIGIVTIPRFTTRLPARPSCVLTLSRTIWRGMVKKGPEARSSFVNSRAAFRVAHRSILNSL